MKYQMTFMDENFKILFLSDVAPKSFNFTELLIRFLNHFVRNENCRYFLLTIEDRRFFASSVEDKIVMIDFNTKEEYSPKGFMNEIISLEKNFEPKKSPSIFHIFKN